MVGDNKKNLLVKYEEEGRHKIAGIPGENKYDKGYSFSKHGFTDVLDSHLSKMEKGRKGRNMDRHMDSYCLKTEESEDESENEEKIKLEKRREERMAKKKVVKTSAVFDN